MNVGLNNFKDEKKCTYKNEKYYVRDNGSVLRLPKKGRKNRKYDNVWTFGTLKKTGYMEIASARVHRIVAFAFHGEPPTNEYVVDHIDTNRQNNRPENLRWVIRLENIILNPITRSKIELLCGCQIEEVLKDISILHNLNLSAQYSWLRTLNQKEADRGLKFWLTIAKREGIDAAKKAVMPQETGPFPDYVYAYTAWIKKRLEGRQITLISYVRSIISGKSNFRCTNGHEWRTTPGDVGNGEGCPICGIGYRKADEIWKSAKLGFVYLMINPDKPGIINIRLSYKTQEDDIFENDWEDWEVYRLRFVEDPALAESIIWKLLGKPLPHDHSPIKMDLSAAEEAFRKLIHLMHKETAMLEKFRGL